MTYKKIKLKESLLIKIFKAESFEIIKHRISYMYEMKLSIASDKDQRRSKLFAFHKRAKFLYYPY